MILKVKKLHDNAILPKKALSGDAAFDLFAVEDGFVNPLSVRSIPIGIATEFPPEFYGDIRTRSSLAKKGIVSLGGVVDSGYRGEWGVILYNSTGSTFNYKAGDRIAQVLFLRVPAAEVNQVAELAESVRGEGGYGSTGR